MSRAVVRFWDPAGTRFGIPTFPWRMAPDGWLTRRQLADWGLRPGGQPIVGQVMWNSRRGVRVAYLYLIELAKPKRVPTAAQWVALGKAQAARRVCPTCGLDRGYVIPRRYGECVPCAMVTEQGAA
jgi:hypothetical protein